MYNWQLKSVFGYKGFTLAELLSALAILGVIATFTIPKVIQAQQNQKWGAIGKETVGAISEAYQAYLLDNPGPVDMRLDDSFFQYFNYIRRQTSGTVDNTQSQGSWTCNAGDRRCYVLANGAVLISDHDYYLRDSNGSNSAVRFLLDPDGVYSGNTTGPGKSLSIWLYTNGRITSRAFINADTVFEISNGSTVTQQPEPAREPPWFEW